MASTLQLMMAAVMFMLNTLLIIISAIVGGAVFKPLLEWYSSLTYTSPPPIDPGIVGWMFPAYFGFLLVLEIVLLYVLWQVIATRNTYPQDFGWF